MAEKGKFITLEGGDGCGKTTQSRLLFMALWEMDIQSTPTHEPGGTVGADSIRRLLVDGKVDRWHPMTEMLLHNAARCEHVERCVKPAIQSGEWVICDRYVDSTLAYQGYGQGVDHTIINQLHLLALGNYLPDLTLFFNLDDEESLKRARERRDMKNRYELMDEAFHHRLWHGYRTIAAENPDRVVTIDATGSRETVHYRVIDTVNARFLTNIRPLSEKMIYDF